METDYDSYALGKWLWLWSSHEDFSVGSCDQGYLRTSDYAWILIRDQEWSQTPQYQTLRDTLAAKWNLDLSIWIQNDVDNGLNCDYDELVLMS